jgi:hypothetical protein
VEASSGLGNASAHQDGREQAISAAVSNLKGRTRDYEDGFTSTHFQESNESLTASVAARILRRARWRDLEALISTDKSTSLQTDAAAP